MTVICLGEALIDLVPTSRQSLRLADQLYVQPGGAPLNIAIGLTRLGVPATFLGSLSTDAFGSKLEALLAAEQVDRWPSERVAAPTRLAVIDHTDTSSPFRFYGSMPADTQLSRHDVDNLLEHLTPDALYVGSLMMTTPESRATLDHALAIARKRNVQVYADPNPRLASWSSRDEMEAATRELFSRSTLGKLSLDDAKTLGWSLDPGSLLASLQCQFDQSIFLTGGEQGSWTLRSGQLVHCPAPRILNPLDPTGAGDAAFAALISATLETGQLGMNEMRFASAAGALATRKRGAIAGLSTREEIERFLADSG